MNVPTGYTALDLVGFTDKGQYNSATAYVQNDLVHYGGNIWRCLIDDTTGITPSESANWTIFISEPTNMTEAIIAPLETSPASAAHAAGDQLIYNDVLYKVTAAIAIGDSLTVGTNIATARKIVYQISATESMIAHIEYSTTASQAYAVGDYLLYDWTLYKVTTAITQGGTITISGGSANVSATTIGAEISSLNSHIANLQTDIASPSLSGTNNTGSPLSVGRFLYNNGTLRRVTQEIANGASITNSNSAVVSDGGLNALIGVDSVSVAGDGTKTYAQVFSSLYALIDSAKVNKNTVLADISATRTIY